MPIWTRLPTNPFTCFFWNVHSHKFPAITTYNNTSVNLIHFQKKINASFYREQMERDFRQQSGGVI